MANPLSIPAGSLRHSITIQAPSTTQDGFGQPTQAWTTVLATRASIEVAKQNELFQSGALTSQVTHTITMRWPSVAIAPGMQALFGSHTYKIQACNNVLERNRVLKLMVLELNGSE